MDENSMAEMWLEAIKFACRKTRLIPVRRALEIVIYLGENWSGQTSRDLAKRIMRSLPEPLKRGNRPLEIKDYELFLHNAFSEFNRLRNLQLLPSLKGRQIRIISDGPSCAPASNLHGTLWGHGKAPKLPLASCQIKHCQCSYQLVSESDMKRYGMTIFPG